MSTAFESIEAAIQEVTDARSRVTRSRARQVRGADAVDSLKSTAHAWFHTHRPAVVAQAPNLELDEVDRHYTTVLNATARYAARTTYLNALKHAKDALVALRAEVAIAPPVQTSAADDSPPDFSPLAGNPEMREILEQRWHECRRCVGADAHLAAIVMMGGFLEALLVARANKMEDKGPLIKAASAPKDRNTGKVRPYPKWTLDSWIHAAHELGWITESAKHVAGVLKEYRNYVHPAKQLRHGVRLALNDSAMFWQVTKALVRQLLQSA